MAQFKPLKSIYEQQKTTAINGNHKLKMIESIEPIDIEQTEEKPSRTCKKKAAQNLQRLGEFLVTMPTVEINRLDIPQELKDAINITKGITRHGARKRQLQYIGVLMREADTTPLNKIMEKMSSLKKF